MKLVRTGWDWGAMAEVGYYQGTSVINGYTYSGAYARNTCDVGFVIFRGMHP